jgi:TorA maturation chaperone TorD
MPILTTVAGISAEFERLLGTALAAQTVDLDTKRRDHARVFTHIENRDCPVHESAYSPGDIFRRADVMADIAAFYRAHGLHVGGENRERVDHIATELEFMSFLARKHAYALENLGPDEVDECRRSQAAFVRDHLACWATGFAARLQLVATDRFYPTIGALLAAWIEAEQTLFDVEPSEDRNEPQPLPEPDDGMCGAVPVATPVSIGKAPA